MAHWKPPGGRDVRYRFSLSEKDARINHIGTMPPWAVGALLPVLMVLRVPACDVVERFRIPISRRCRLERPRYLLLPPPVESAGHRTYA